MSNEVSPWKLPGCSFEIQTSRLSQREPFSSEINKTFGEGGALNATYRTVEAAAIAANRLGIDGLQYGTDFIFKTGGGDSISFDFRDPATAERAKEVLLTQ